LLLLLEELLGHLQIRGRESGLLLRVYNLDCRELQRSTRHGGKRHRCGRAVEGETHHARTRERIEARDDGHLLPERHVQAKRARVSAALEKHDAFGGAELQVVGAVFKWPIHDPEDGAPDAGRPRRCAHGKVRTRRPVQRLHVADHLAELEAEQRARRRRLLGQRGNVWHVGRQRAHHEFADLKPCVVRDLHGGAVRKNQNRARVAGAGQNRMVLDEDVAVAQCRLGLVRQIQPLHVASDIRRLDCSDDHSTPTTGLGEPPRPRKHQQNADEKRAAEEGHGRGVAVSEAR
jgi:hypothetical protein